MKVDIIDGLAYGIQQYLGSYKHQSTNETEYTHTAQNNVCRARHVERDINDGTIEAVKVISLVELIRELTPIHCTRLSETFYRVGNNVRRTRREQDSEQRRVFN